MRAVRRWEVAAAAIAALTLAVAYAAQSHWVWTPLFLLCAAPFGFGRRLAWRGAPHASAAALIGGAVVGVWLGSPPWAMALAVIAALCAWDLAGLEERAGDADGEAVSALARAHLARLAATAAAGGLVVAVALTVELKVDFWLVFAAALFLVVSLSAALRLLKARSPER